MERSNQKNRNCILHSLQNDATYGTIRITIRIGSTSGYIKIEFLFAEFFFRFWAISIICGEYSKIINYRIQVNLFDNLFLSVLKMQGRKVLSHIFWQFERFTACQISSRKMSRRISFQTKFHYISIPIKRK